MRKIRIALGACLGAYACLAVDYGTFTADGTVAFGEIAEASTITIDSGVTVTSSTAFTGSGLLTVSGGGTLVLSAASPGHSGGIRIGKAVVKVDAPNALGTGTVTIQGKTDAGGTSQLFFATGSFGQAYPNDIVLESTSTKQNEEASANTALWFDAPTSAIELNGTVTAHGNIGMYNPRPKSGGTSNTATVKFNNSVTVEGAIQTYAVNQTQADYHFYGPVTATLVKSYGNANSSNPFIHLYNANNRIGAVQYQYKGGIYPKVDDACGGAALSVVSNVRWNFDLGGHNQTMAYVSSAVTKSEKKAITTSAAATLTLTGGVSSASCCVWVGLSGKISLVVDDKGEAGTFTQTFLSDESTVTTMSGGVTVRRGNLVFSGAGTYPSVNRLVVEGGSFTLSTTGAGAFAGITNLTVGATGRLTLSADVTTPFPEDSSMDVFLETGATLELPGVSDVYARYLFLNSQGQPIGTYTHAEIPEIPEGVTVHVANAPVEETVDIAWTGTMSDALAPAANWGLTGADLGFGGDKYRATFAPVEAVRRTATVTADATFHGLVFAGDDFILTSGQGNPTVGVYGDGIAFTDDSAANETAHAYTVEPKIDFRLPTTVTVPQLDTLTFADGLTTTEDVAFHGLGKVQLGGTSEFTGSITVSNAYFLCYGTVGAADGSSGPLLIDADPVNGSGGRLLFSNAVVNARMNLRNRQSHNGYLDFKGVTNRFAGAVSFGSRSCTLGINSASTVVFEGGVSGNIKLYITGGGTMVVRGTPAGQLGSSEGNPLATQSPGGRLVLQTSDNLIRWIKPTHALVVRTEADYALNGRTGALQYSLNKSSTFDLASTRQRVQELEGVSGGTITGEQGDVLELAPGEGLVSTVASRVNGAVSLLVDAGGTVILTNSAFASSGDISVTNGTLEIAHDATWLNGTNVTVSGTGVLKLGSAAFNKDHAVLHLAGNGSFEIADGVTASFAEAFFLDAGTGREVRIAPGSYTRATASGPLAGRIAGGGTVYVRSLGTMVLFR